MICSHRRRINTEEKAKVVAAAWGTELTPFLAALAIFFFFRFFLGPTGPIFLNYITYFISAHFSLLLGAAPSAAGCS